MTDEMMTRRGLMEKSADSGLLCEMSGFAAEPLMEKGGPTKAALGEESPARLVQGYGDPA